MSENLHIWDKVCITDPKNTKEVKFGRKFTAIDAYSQLRAGTELWGPYGAAWGLFDLRYEYVPETNIAMLHATFRYPGGEFPITNSIFYISEKGKPDDEWVKKIETNTITKALSRLGFNADVFTGQFDDDRYIEYAEKVYKKDFTDIQKFEFYELLDTARPLDLLLFMRSLPQETWIALNRTFEHGQKGKMKELVNSLITQAMDMTDAYYESAVQTIANNDVDGLLELISECGRKVWELAIYPQMTGEQQFKLTEMRKSLKANGD